MSFPDCLMSLKARTALIRNEMVTPTMLVEAANACRCRDCNEALERYAHIALRNKFGASKGGIASVTLE